MPKPQLPPPTKTTNESLIPPDQRETLLQIMKGMEDRLSDVIQARDRATQERLDSHEGRLLQVERAQVAYKDLALEIRTLSKDVRSLLEYSVAFGARDIEYEKRLVRIEVSGLRAAMLFGALSGALASFLVAMVLVWGFRHGLLK